MNIQTIDNEQTEKMKLVLTALFNNKHNQSNIKVFNFDDTYLKMFNQCRGILENNLDKELTDDEVMKEAIWVLNKMLTI